MPSRRAEQLDDQCLPDGPAIVRRLMCLFVVADAGINGDHSNARGLVQQWNLEENLSPQEASFLAIDDAKSSQCNQMSWRIEAMIPLMWAVGLLDEMPPPDDQFDAEYLAQYWNTVPADFAASATRRPKREILDQAERIHHLHWTLRDAQLNGLAPPDGLEPGVVQERHYGLNWLSGHSRDDWDAVTTDT